MSNDPNELRVEETNPHAYYRIMDAQAFYTDMLTALIANAIKHRMFASTRSVESVMEAIAELAWEDKASDIEALQALGYNITSYPENHKALCEGAAEAITDSMRLKPIDYTDALHSTLALIKQKSIAFNTKP